jgi:hypothetical protein
LDNGKVDKSSTSWLRSDRIRVLRHRSHNNGVQSERLLATTAGFVAQSAAQFATFSRFQPTFLRDKQRCTL